MRVYPWYDVVEQDAPLEQGDFLSSFPIASVPADIIDFPSAHDKSEERGLNIPVKTYNLIIMTQSCDLIDVPDETEILLCYHLSYREAIEIRPKLKGRSGWGNLRKGNVVGLHLLNKCELEGNKFDYQIIDLQKVFTSPLIVVRAHAKTQGKRVRLCPPYREHLAQAFARRFMRIGLPAVLPNELPEMQ